jgi:CRISPR/Cas system Type II protein with McrA/HNH and RuvC-like nuclease domain
VINLALSEDFFLIAESLDKLPAPQETSNPIVNKGMHELRRVVNAVIKQYGKPDVVRIEMARDLEMNTKRYKENEMRQRKNQKANEKAIEVFRQEVGKKYPSHDEKIRYRSRRNSCMPLLTIGLEVSCGAGNLSKLSVFLFSTISS